MQTRRIPFRRVLGVVAVAACAGLLWSAPAGAQDDDPLQVSATVNGRDVEGAGSNDPVELQPLEVTDAEIEVTNNTGSDITVKRARLFGKAFGLTFVAYDAVVEVPVPAESSAIIEIPIEFVDLERQATGLLPGGFALYDSNREVVGQQDFVIDVRGSATSALGLFGIFITVATIIGLVGIYLGVKRRTLEPKRWRRAVRFAFVGLGMGLTAVVALAVFRVVAPTPIVWIPLTILPTVGGASSGSSHRGRSGWTRTPRRRTWTPSRSGSTSPRWTGSTSRRRRRPPGRGRPRRRSRAAIRARPTRYPGTSTVDDPGVSTRWPARSPRRWRGVRPRRGGTTRAGVDGSRSR
ncbi:MAG: hypothetical protein R2716_08140 [Microthrixaceae bacterium]